MVNTANQADVKVIHVQGEFLDASNVKEFKQDMAAVLSDNLRVVFDFSKVHFVDSSGLGAILSCLRQLNGKGGDLKVCGLAKPVRALFELVRMHKVLDIYNSQDEALSAFARSQQR